MHRISLPNGNIIYWSRRDGYRIPMKCGKCGREWRSYAQNIRKENFTGFCHSCAHTGEDGNSWKGGRTMKGGYFQLKVYPDHPFYKEMASSTGYIPEHRLVMAHHIGRPLSSQEVVHHINSNKHDNRIENLELYTSFKEHGQKLQERMPHPGFVPTKKLAKIVEMVKRMLENDDDEE
jgi:HNH endonuclease